MYVPQLTIMHVQSNPLFSFWSCFHTKVSKIWVIPWEGPRNFCLRWSRIGCLHFNDRGTLTNCMQKIRISSHIMSYFNICVCLCEFYGQTILCVNPWCATCVSFVFTKNSWVCRSKFISILHVYNMHVCVRDTFHLTVCKFKGHNSLFIWDSTPCTHDASSLTNNPYF